MVVRVLFVCTGNICRSPMAEGLFQHLVNGAGLSDQIVVDSAGTDSYHVGEPAHRGTRRVLAKHGIHYTGRARRLSRADLQNFDYILAMDRDNLYGIESMKPNGADAEIRMFLDYAPGVSTDEVPDPYYDGRFEEVYQLVRQGAEGLLAHIREKHGL